MCLLSLDKSNEKYVNNSYVMNIYSSLKQIFCKHLYIKELLMHDFAVFTSYLSDIDESLVSCMASQEGQNVFKYTLLTR